MARLTLLDQMRMQRDQRESAVTAPVRAALAEERAAHRLTIGRLNELQRLAGEKIFRHVLEEFADALSQKMSQVAYDAAMKADPSVSDIVTLQVSRYDLMAQDDQSWVAEAIHRYASHSAASFAVRVEPNVPVLADAVYRTKTLVMGFPSFNFAKQIVEY